MAAKPLNRYLVLAAASVTAGLGGAIYMWSIFNKPLMEAHGWTPQDVSMTYSIYLLMICIMGFFAGWLQKRVPAKWIVLVSGIAFSAGWFLAGCVDSIPALWLTFGLIGGGGCGFVYNTSVSVVTLWFPDKRGFANGVCLGAIALSSLIFAPLGNYFIETMDVSTAFKVCGGIFFLCYAICSWFLVKPDPEWKPKGFDPTAVTKTASTARSYKTTEMLKTPYFWVLWVMFAFTATSGMMMTGHVSGIGQQLVGMTASQGALMVGIMAVANFTGRLVFGSLSDKFGRYVVLLGVVAVTALDMLFLFPIATQFGLFVAALSIVGCCFGGIMAILPALCGDVFGPANFGQNYAWVYSGYTVASFIGPMTAASVVASSGSYNQAFIVAGVLSIAGFALIMVISKLAKKLRAAETAEAAAE